MRSLLDRLGLLLIGLFAIGEIGSAYMAFQSRPSPEPEPKLEQLRLEPAEWDFGNIGQQESHVAEFQVVNDYLPLRYRVLM